MGYEPTVDDYAFLYEHAPESFSSPNYARIELDKLRNSPDPTDDPLRINALGANYAQRNGGPLTESPIPADPFPNDDGVMDPEFAAVCDCQAGEPCCMTAGIVKDKSDGTRFVRWPVTSDTQATTLLLVANEMERDKLVGKVEMSGIGSGCKVGWSDRPNFKTRTSQGAERTIPKSGGDLSVGYSQMMNLSGGLNGFIDPEYVKAFVAVDALLAATSLQRGVSGATVTPFQCVTDAPLQTTMRVIPVPQIELSGSATGSITVNFRTSGVSASAGLSGSITGKYGPYDITASAKAEPSISPKNPPASDAEVSGMLGTLSGIISRMSDTVSASSPRPAAEAITPRTTMKPDGTHALAPGSGVTFFMELGLEPTGIILQGKPSSPDLELAIGGLKSTLKMTATGIIDFIEVAAAVLLSPAGARAVSQIRAEMANPDNAVRGDVRAEVEVSASGDLLHEFNSGLSYVIPAVGEGGIELGDDEKKLEGSITLRGGARISIHVEAEVWIATAEAGAAGTLATGWTWQIQKNGNGQREKRYYFEGLKARAAGYARVEIKSRVQNNSERAGDDDFTSSGVTATANALDSSGGGSDFAELGGSSGGVYTLIAPTVERVTDHSPPWVAY